MLVEHVKCTGLGKLSECDVLVFESPHKLPIKNATLKVAVHKFMAQKYAY